MKVSIMLTVYHVLSTILFAILFVIWSSNHWVNTFIKMVLFSMMVFGIISTIYGAGFIIDAPAGTRWL